MYLVFIVLLSGDDRRHSTCFRVSDIIASHDSVSGWQRGLEPNSRDFLFGNLLFAPVDCGDADGSGKSAILGNICQVRYDKES